MVATEDSVWFYFTKLADNSVKCLHCNNFNRKKDKTGSTGNMISHLKDKHPELDAKRLKAIGEKKKRTTESIPKITSIFPAESPSSSNGTPTPAKKSRISSGETGVSNANETIVGNFNKWTENGEGTKKLDKLIVEMIATDIMPLRTVEKPGFKRLINYLAPQYKFKSRQFYTNNNLPSIYEKVMERVKHDISIEKSVSITTDIWTAQNSRDSISILSITVHFIRMDGNGQLAPFYLVGSTTRIKGSHSGPKIAETIECALQKLGMDKSKVNLVLRDAQSSMISGMNIFEVESQDCFLHKLQLCVKDGLTVFRNFKPVVEKMKKVIRKVRKSALQKEYLRKLQTDLDLPNHVLVKNMEVRWNSTYFMCSRFLANKRAIEIFVDCDATGKAMEHFEEVEWNMIEVICNILSPIYIVTKDLESRRATISRVLPVYRCLVSKMIKMDNPMAKKIAEGLDSRMDGWEFKKKLIIPTILDPNYKMYFFERAMKDIYRNWIIEELSDAIPILRRSDQSAEIRIEKNANPIDDMLDEYLQENNSNDPLEIDLNTNEAVLVRQELDAYLNEDRVKTDCFIYWSVNGAKWPHLLKLFIKYNSAPVGSQESERLFSTAGAILNNLRNNLSAENLEKLLFLHHNLPIYDYKY